MVERVVVVVAGGGVPPRSVLSELPRGAPVVAADSGADVARALGLRVDVVVGDLDSITVEGLRAARDAGADIVQYPASKDATDLALALERGAGLLGGVVAGSGELVVLGGDGGRLDHLLAGALALADPAWSRFAVRAHFGPATVHVLHGPAERDIGGSVGDLLTLVPVGGTVAGIRTRGLRFPLRDEPLHPGTTRGVSNVIDVLPATVAVATGTLLAIRPGVDWDIDGGDR